MQNIYNHPAIRLHVSALFGHNQGGAGQRKKNTTLANVQLWS